MGLHNAHVIKYFRWKYWLARDQRRLLAMTFISQWVRDEYAKAAP